jgi:NADPH:quinone reductase-like Zn-dependent oxidoreductase
VQEESIKPVIDSVYSLNDLATAHQKVSTGHVSGKVVLDHPE